MKLKWLRTQPHVDTLVRCAEPTASDPLAQRDTYTSWRTQFIPRDPYWAAYSLLEDAPTARFRREEEAKAYAEVTYILQKANDGA